MTVEAAGTGPGAGVGRTELGMISLAERAVVKIAARAATENPDAGAAAARVLGRPVPGAGRFGVRGTDLAGLPKIAAEVDGATVYLALELAVRWPASVPDVTEQVRVHLLARVAELTGLVVEEVHIVVADLATDIIPPPRVR